MEHDPGTAEALRVVEDVAKETMEEGRARITVERSDGGWFISLIPANPRACAVSLTADYPPQIDMFLGPEPTTASYEFWRDSWPENLTLLRDLLEAVIAGRYEQTIDKRRRGLTVTGRFDLPAGEHTHSETGRAPEGLGSREPYVLHFEPY